MKFAEEATPLYKPGAVKVVLARVSSHFDVSSKVWKANDSALRAPDSLHLHLAYLHCFRKGIPLLSSFVDVTWVGDCRKNAYFSRGIFLVGGQMFSAKLLRRLRAVFPICGFGLPRQQMLFSECQI